MGLTVYLDAVMILLLLATIGYAIKLHRDLARLRSAKDEMATFAKQFDESYARAEAGIARLKQADTEILTPLRREVERAQALRDELAFLGSRSRPHAGAAGASPVSTSAAGAAPRREATSMPVANAAIGAVAGGVPKATTERLGPAGTPLATRRPSIKAVGGTDPKRPVDGLQSPPRSLVERDLLEAIRAAGGRR